MTAAVLAPGARAQSDYPNRPVRIVAGFAAGSSTDIMARLVGGRMGQALGQQFIVENRPGAGSAIAAEQVARGPKDGYAIMIGGSANLTTQIVSPSQSYDILKDFSPLLLISSQPLILVVHPSIGVRTLPELIALAKAQAEPLTYGSTGVGAVPHLVTELFAVRTGVKLVHVPYPGSPQAITDLLAGRIAMMFSPATAVLPHIESGKLTAIASASAKRPSAAPNLPTMAEAGMPDFDSSIWFAMWVPAGTPREVVDKLSRAGNDAIRSDEVQANFKSQGFDAIGGTPDDFARLIDREMEKWTVAVQAAGLKK